MVKRFYRPQLDIVRFLAFLSVFGHHVLPRTGPRNRMLLTAANTMGFGLCLFFVLSAYLIGLLLLREREVSGGVDLPAFYKRRILRIWPLYLIGLALGVIRSVLHGVFHQDAAWFVAALLLCGNLGNPSGILTGHLWSISVEEQFYLFFPSACGSFGRRGVLLFSMLLIVLANGTLLYLAHTSANLDWQVWSNSLVQSEMFAAGLLLALADAKLPHWRTTTSIAALAGALVLLFCTERAFHLKTMGATASTGWKLCLGYALVAAACCLLITALQNLPAPGALAYCGRISYGLYVFHVPAIAFLMSRVPTKAGGTLLSLAATFGLAALSYHYLETPFLQWKRRYEIISTRAATI